MGWHVRLRHNSFSELSSPLLALEEPEAHLHLFAIRSLWSALSAVPGQKIVASHSGDLVANASLTSAPSTSLACFAEKVTAPGPRYLPQETVVPMGCPPRLGSPSSVAVRCSVAVAGLRDGLLGRVDLDYRRRVGIDVLAVAAARGAPAVDHPHRIQRRRHLLGLAVHSKNPDQLPIAEIPGNDNPEDILVAARQEMSGLAAIAPGLETVVRAGGNIGPDQCRSCTNWAQHGGAASSSNRAAGSGHSIQY